MPSRHRHLDAGVGAAHQRAELLDYTGESGTLVVNVSGFFNGAKKSRVVTFAIGEVKPSSTGTRVQPDNGPAFKALPSAK